MAANARHEPQARESRKHDNSDIPDIIASAVGSVLGPADRRRRLSTPDSTDDGSILVPPRKKVKRDSDVDSHQSISRNSSAPTPMGLSSANYSPWASLMGHGGVPFQDAYRTPSSSSPFSTFSDFPGGAKIWGRRGDEERQNFQIHEETEEEQDDAEQIAATIYDPSFGDDNKENESAERDEEPPSVDPTQEFDLVRNVLGELLDYNQPPPDNQFAVSSVLLSQAVEFDEEDLPELPEDPHFEGPLTPPSENMLDEDEPSTGLPFEGAWTDECDENTDNEYVQGDGYTEL
ncbi:hypothetical protein PISL3812_01675 [Talaromyces islandicus]|uniref:Uncharacterized protein n=1 Tax=Talaromyces islandicus TaxID=28573 RepID=A0A0U1LMR2_TALIS|nr:hypothetical protein PISL3812_01675 [Talaromyces islandicus]